MLQRIVPHVSIGPIALLSQCLHPDGCAPLGSSSGSHVANTLSSRWLLWWLSRRTTALQSSFHPSPCSLPSAEEPPQPICYHISQNLATCAQDFSPGAACLVLLFTVYLLFSFLKEVFFFRISFCSFGHGSQILPIAKPLKYFPCPLSALHSCSLERSNEGVPAERLSTRFMKPDLGLVCL